MSYSHLCQAGSIVNMMPGFCCCCCSGMQVTTYQEKTIIMRFLSVLNLSFLKESGNFNYLSIHASLPSLLCLFVLVTERLHFHFSLSCIGEGNGNPLQCSCLENPRDGGAWQAAVYGVAQSRTQLKRLSSSSKFQHTSIYSIIGSETTLKAKVRIC